MSKADVEHYGLNWDCDCVICARINSLQKLSKASLPERREPSAGEDWVAEMLALIEKFAPDMTPKWLKTELLVFRVFQDRNEEELEHYGRHGHFLTHTPEQAGAERRAKECAESQRE